MEKWYDFALKEIERSSRRLTEFEKLFLLSIKKQLARGIGLSEKQEKVLIGIHGKMTDVSVRR
jgi:hypothetical protein